MLSKARALTLFMGTLAMVSACAKPIDPVILESPSYQEGYTHGCTTAHERQNGYGSPVIRNEGQFETDEAYRIGWRNGFGACGGTSANPYEYNEDQWYHD